MKTVMVVFGTRPEAIKMCPLVNELKANGQYNVVVTVTGQHREMLDQVLTAFKVVPDYDLAIMKSKQTLFDITCGVLKGMEEVLSKVKPDLVLVHGDTTTSFATALSAFYLRIPVGHVEAGLRTRDIYAPYPEEFNRQAVSIVSSLNFSPTTEAKENLVIEKHDKNVSITGNTAIDALKTTVSKEHKLDLLDWASGSRLIFLTAHRRENWGEPFENIFKAVLRILNEFPDTKVIYPVHKNPIVRDAANKILGNNDRVKLIEPLDVVDCHNVMANSYLIMTDSGGIQEEAPSMNVPVLVLRDVTERPEGLYCNVLKLVGTDEKVIHDAAYELLSGKNAYEGMRNKGNPYGDGHACERIIKAIDSFFKEN